MTVIHLPFFRSISFQKETVAKAMLDFCASYKEKKSSIASIVISNNKWYKSLLSSKIR